MMFVTPKTMEFVDALMRFGTVNKKFMNEFLVKLYLEKAKLENNLKMHCKKVTTQELPKRLLTI